MGPGSDFLGDSTLGVGSGFLGDDTLAGSAGFGAGTAGGGNRHPWRTYHAMQAGSLLQSLHSRCCP